jgi:Uma2 family endonuclease
MATEKTLLTADDLLRMPDDEMRHELVRGELRTMPPAGFEHGWVAGRAFLLLSQFVDVHRSGWVLAAETGFHIFRDPDTVRAPDVAFVAARRIPAGNLPRSFPQLAPDLVVEVVSPGDTNREVESKVDDWLEAGVRLAWVVHPARRTATVYGPDLEPSVLGEADDLDGGDVLPGFTCSVRELFGG